MLARVYGFAVFHRAARITVGKTQSDFSRDRNLLRWGEDIMQALKCSTNTSGLTPLRILNKNSHALLKFGAKMLANATRLRIFAYVLMQTLGVTAFGFLKFLKGIIL